MGMVMVVTINSTYKLVNTIESIFNVCMTRKKNRVEKKL